MVCLCVGRRSTWEETYYARLRTRWNDHRHPDYPVHLGTSLNTVRRGVRIYSPPPLVSQGMHDRIRHLWNCRDRSGHVLHHAPTLTRRVIRSEHTWPFRAT